MVAGTAAKVHLQLLERVLPHRTSRDCVAESGRFNIEWPGELAAADLPKFVMFKQGKGTLSFQVSYLSGVYVELHQKQSLHIIHLGDCSLWICSRVL